MPRGPDVVIRRRRPPSPRRHAYVIDDAPPVRREFVDRREMRASYMDTIPFRGSRHYPEPWERDLLRPEPGVTIESVREIHPGERNYEKYLYGREFTRMDRPPYEPRGPPIREVIREPTYVTRRPEIREPVYTRGNWRENFRGADYIEDIY